MSVMDTETRSFMKLDACHAATEIQSGIKVEAVRLVKERGSWRRGPWSTSTFTRAFCASG
ncbi:hypothetical protein RPYSC3_13450 [Rhodopseudomonas palustris]|nr:hypothetical protein RPYSC3_13450 [Rhodopseudomonas palustris]